MTQENEEPLTAEELETLKSGGTPNKNFSHRQTREENPRDDDVRGYVNRATITTENTPSKNAD